MVLQFLFLLKKNAYDWIGDLVTRFSGFTIGCITTGVIWITKPESFMDVILYDNLHVFLWVGGLFDWGQTGNIIAMCAMGSCIIQDYY